MSFSTYLERKYTFSFLAILLAFVLLLAGCGNGEQGAEEPANDDEGTEQAEEKTNESNVRTIEHAMGTTEVEGTPKRIVTLYQGATDAAVALDIKPVGVVESWVNPPKYKYLRDDLEGAEIVGKETQPNLEEIAKLNPDLIIASKLRHEEVYDKLKQIAPTVTHETVFRFKETVELVGEAANKEQKANEVITAYEERVANFQEKAKAELGDEWPLNVALLNFREDHARIYFTSFAGTVLKDLGFERPENQQADKWGTKLTSKESIPEMNADIFYVFFTDDPAKQKTYEEWSSHPLWENLDAVKNDQVNKVDVVTWNMSGGIIGANRMIDDVYDRLGLEE